MGKLDRLWRSRAIRHPLKACLIQTVVWPIVTYGAEACTPGKSRKSVKLLSVPWTDINGVVSIVLLLLVGN